MSDPIRCGPLLVVLLLLCSACDRASITARPDSLPGTTSQAAIEYAALDKPFPQYPARSLENGAAGVAVASIVVGLDGRMERVDVLESPDADIAEALQDTLERWVLPVHPSGPLRTAATMVFYFLIEAGEGRVVSGLSLAAERTGGGRSVTGERLRRIDEVELETLLETGAVVVDPRVRDLYARSHRDGAINLPLRELQSRAAVELLPAQVVVVDCYRGLEGMCDMAGQILLRLVGVPDVVVFVHD